ncbi:MAG: LysR family transcriptional regulator [Chloroflexi bacterium]|nr:LysR family transcriptional regulator [Chloroflexota bacterium]
MSILAPSWLKVFLAVAEHGSFNKAAEVLLLSQPAVSQKIRQLEVALGIRLFDRTPNGAHLTPEGEILRRYAHAMRWLMLAAEANIVGPTQTIKRRLNLGGTPTLSSYCLPAWLKTFHQQHPNILVHLRTDTTSHLVDNIARHALHLAIIEGELPDETTVAYTVLEEIPFLLVTPPEAPWTNHESLPLSALHGQRFVARPPEAQTRRWMDRIFAQHHIQPHIVAELDSPEAIKEAVSHGLGVTLLPKCMLEDDLDSPRLHILTITDVPLKRYLKAIWPKDIPLHPSAVAFLNSLKSTFPHLEDVLQKARHPDLETLYTLLEDNTSP